MVPVLSGGLKGLKAQGPGAGIPRSPSGYLLPISSEYQSFEGKTEKADKTFKNSSDLPILTSHKLA